MATPEEEPQPIQAETAPGGMNALTVEVQEGATLKDESGQHREPGGTFDVEGLTAVALAQTGAVKIVGTAEEEIDVDARAEAALAAHAEQLQARVKDEA
jgi:hypothetical protein